MPCAMKPAPTIPPFTGVPARSSSSSLRSTINMARSVLIGGREQARAFSEKIGPTAVPVGDDRGLGWPVDPARVIVPAHAELVLRGGNVGTGVSDPDRVRQEPEK